MAPHLESEDEISEVEDQQQQKHFLMAPKTLQGTGPDAALDLDLDIEEELLETGDPLDKEDSDDDSGDLAPEGLTSADPVVCVAEQEAKSKILDNHGREGCPRTESPPQVQHSYIKRVRRKPSRPVRIRVRRCHRRRGQQEKVSMSRNPDQNYELELIGSGAMIEDGKTAAALAPFVRNREESESDVSSDGSWSPASDEVGVSEDILEPLQLDPPKMAANNKVTENFMQELIRYAVLTVI